MAAINRRDPGHAGPVCAACQGYIDGRRQQADNVPMLRSPYGGGEHPSPHRGTYLHEAAYTRWACTQGHHGPLSVPF